MLNNNVFSVLQCYNRPISGQCINLTLASVLL